MSTHYYILMIPDRVACIPGTRRAAFYRRNTAADNTGRHIAQNNAATFGDILQLTDNTGRVKVVSDQTNKPATQAH